MIGLGSMYQNYNLFILKEDIPLPPKKNKLQNFPFHTSI